MKLVGMRVRVCGFVDAIMIGASCNLEIGRLCSDMEGYVGQIRIPAADGQRRFPGFPCRCRRYIYPALTRSLTGGKHLGSAQREVAPTAVC